MLKYIGDGAALPEVPARDLSEAEVEQFGKEFLLASGLYAEPEDTRREQFETRAEPER